MPTGNLPSEGKALWERVYEQSKKGSCKGDEECAARVAWTAVKNAGWSKDKEGNWHKRSIASEFSLAITKASYEKGSNHPMRFLAVASDTDEDSFEDNMTLSLFRDFVNRIQSAELPPEHFRSKFWSGGVPYMSISHYPDLDGKAVPGVVESVYIDGNRLKAKGYFLDTPLGRACFNSVCKDLYGNEPHPEGKIRISIAFLDYAHKHKSNGFMFERTEETPLCMECLKEMLDKSVSGKEFLLGHLIHLALTRVPVNKRTSLEVKSMSISTRKEDALSIVGDSEEAKSEIEEINKEAKMVGKSELVIKSEGEEIPEEPEIIEEAKASKEDEPESKEDDEDSDESKKEKKMQKSEVDLAPVLEEFRSLRSLVERLADSKKESHPLDEIFNTLRSRYDQVVDMPLSAEDKLRELQEPFNDFSQALIEQVRSTVQIEKADISPTETPSVDAVTNAVMQKIGPTLEEIKSMLAHQQQIAPADVTQPATQQDIRSMVHRRSLLPSERPNPQPLAPQTKPTVVKSILELAEKTTQPR